MRIEKRKKTPRRLNYIYSSLRMAISNTLNDAFMQFSLLLIVFFCFAAHIGTRGRGGGCGTAAVDAVVVEDTVTGNLSFSMTSSIQFLNSLTLANTELLSFAEHLYRSNI